MIFKNFRPVSYLPFVAKVDEQAVIGRLLAHCKIDAPIPVNQSSYRTFHSKETALVKVQSDILMAMDRREVSLLVLLDLCAALETIGHRNSLNVMA